MYSHTYAHALAAENDRRTLDVSQYTDDELLSHLGFGENGEVGTADHPLQDEQLMQAIDARIASSAHDDPALMQFYVEIRARFFPEEQEEDEPDPDEEEQEDEPDEDEEQEEEEPEEPEEPEDRAFKRARRETLVSGSGGSGGGSGAPQVVVTTDKLLRGTVNPIDRQIIVKTLILNSQSRDPAYASATDFKFHFSDILRNVVKLSLYSISVPYHWYTISNAYGSDFFVLVGSAPGIDGADPDGPGVPQSIRVQVPSGNYTPASIVAAVNAAIAGLPQLYPAVDFRGSAAAFDAATGLASLTLDLANTYATAYWTAQWASGDDNGGDFVYPSSDEDARKTSLYSFLGFNRRLYNPCCAYSLELGQDITDTNITKLQLTEAADCTFVLVRYSSAVAASAGSSAKASLLGEGLPRYSLEDDAEAADTGAGAGAGAPLASGIVVLDRLAVSVPQGTYTQRSLVTAVNVALAAVERVDMAPAFLADPARATQTTDARANLLPLGGAYLACEEIADDPAHALFGKFRLAWSLRMSRANTRAAPREQLAIVLPNHLAWLRTATTAGGGGEETSTAGLNFPARVLHLQQTAAETAFAASNFEIAAGTSITLTLVSEVAAAGPYVASVAASSAGSTGYTLRDYLAAINAGLAALNATSAPDSPAPPRAVHAHSASISTVTGLFALSVDYALDFDSRHYTYGIAATDVAAELLKMPLAAAGSALPEDGALSAAITVQGTYTVAPGATLFTLGVSAAGVTAGLLDGPARAVAFRHAGAPNADGKYAYSYSALIERVNASLGAYVDRDSAYTLARSSLAIENDGAAIRLRLKIVCAREFTESNMVLTLAGGGGGGPPVGDPPISTLSWSTNLFLTKEAYNLSLDADAQQVGTARVVQGTKQVLSDELKLSAPAVLSFPGAYDADLSGASDSSYSSSSSSTTPTMVTNNVSGADAAQIEVPAGTYTRQNLLIAINSLLAAHPVLRGSALTTETDALTGAQTCVARWSVQRVYGAESYRLVFYSSDFFVKCYVGARNVRNIRPTETLGWILGFRANYQYALTEENLTRAAADDDFDVVSATYYGDTGNRFALAAAADGVTGATITGDTTVNVNLYDTLFLTWDDYTQSRVNDTLVTIAPNDAQFVLPNRITRLVRKCDLGAEAGSGGGSGSGSGSSGIAGADAASLSLLTQNQLYANAVLLEAQAQQANANASSTTGEGRSNSEFVQPTNTFAVLPLKLGSTTFGQVFVENGGTLQSQGRTYLGAVSIAGGTIRLLTDRGDPIDLNGQNWSFTVLCEQLASPTV